MSLFFAKQRKAIRRSFAFLGLISLPLLAGCPGATDYAIEMPGGYTTHASSAHTVYISKANSGGVSTVPEKVTDIAYDDKYILAKQMKLMADPESENGYQIPNEKETYFWIIAIESDTVIGPLSKSEFKEKREELGVSEKLVLKDTSSYRK